MRERDMYRDYLTNYCKHLYRKILRNGEYVHYNCLITEEICIGAHTNFLRRRFLGRDRLNVNEIKECFSREELSDKVQGDLEVCQQ